MHLLDVHTRKLKYFAGDAPLYAILSHTWGDDEVTHQDIDKAGVEQRAGYAKVRMMCELAAFNGFQYVWIDTCCIDKSSSAELSEAINSMYWWYQQATVCYAYLSDVLVQASSLLLSSQLKGSRYFTRGWTLQELLAAATVIFLNADWREIGTKLTLMNDLSTITGIPTRFLFGADLQGASVAQRMSWTSRRATTRVEDCAYCLLGIFGVNIPLLYGEGKRAFARLQEEIIKTVDDYGIFAWRLRAPQAAGMVSPSPAGFHLLQDIIPDEAFREPDEAIVINNKGVHLQAKILEGFWRDQKSLAVLPCIRASDRRQVAIYVQALSETGTFFRRSDHHRLEYVDPQQTQQLKSRRVCIQHELWMESKTYPQLAQAAADGNVKVLQLLLERDRDPNFGTHAGLSPLAMAVRSEDENAVRLLLKYGAHLGHIADNRSTVLGLAVDNALSLGLDFGGCSLDSEDTQGGKAQQRFARLVGIIDALLDTGANPDEMHRGQTVMRSALDNGHDDVVRMLLRKADLEYCPDRFSPPLLAIAAESGRLSVVQMLLECGATIESRDINGHTALMYSACADHGDIVELLLNRGADLEAKDDHGQTALSWAAYRGCQDGVHMLLKHGADVESRDKLGFTPLMKAIVRRPRFDTKDRSHPSFYDVKPAPGRRHNAFETGWDAVVRLLLDKGASRSVTDTRGSTALSLAQAFGVPATVELLVDYPSRSGKRSSHDGDGEGHVVQKRPLLTLGAEIQGRDDAAEETECAQVSF